MKIIEWKSLGRHRPSWWPARARVLAVAVEREDGWCVYIDAVEGFDHETEAVEVARTGSKIPEHLARAIFPLLEGPYAS